MATTKKAIKISEWAPVNDNEFRYEGVNRNARHIAIGTMTQAGGTEQYITEGIYSDLLPQIQEKKLTVHVDIYSDPPIVLEKDGKLVPHNANVQILKEDTLAILSEKTTTMSNQIRSLVELRNNLYAEASLGRAIKVLRQILSEEMESPINYDFIRLVLREKYINDKDLSDLEREFHTYTKEELISVYGGILEKKITGAVRIEPMKSLVTDNISVDQIETALKNEIARRFFSGAIS